MSTPLVSAVMLVHAGREKMAERARRCFESQTYPNKELIVHEDDGSGKTIGALRNEANAKAGGEIIVHWDSDDWSHRERIDEQVTLLTVGDRLGTQGVGYRQMLFWRDPSGRYAVPASAGDVLTGEAWLYHNPRQQYCLGTSLCYWRSAWQMHTFPDLPKAKGGTGEDTEWLRGIHSVGTTSIRWKAARMIAAIHSQNSQYYGDDMLQPPFWTRVPEWDEYCRKVMAL